MTGGLPPGAIPLSLMNCVFMITEYCVLVVTNYCVVLFTDNNTEIIRVQNNDTGVDMI